MKQLIVLSSLLLLLPLASGCNRGGEAQADTQRVDRPATPPPASPAETDTALTQTVEIGENRSENEGGVLTKGTVPENGNTSDATATATPTATAAAPAPSTAGTPPPAP